MSKMCWKSLVRTAHSQDKCVPCVNAEVGRKRALPREYRGYRDDSVQRWTSNHG